jgi:hypothetical protein
MEMLLSQTDLTYKLNGNNLVIITDKRQQTAAISISGVVSDAKGPLPGVSVKLKGTQVACFDRWEW